MKNGMFHLIPLFVVRNIIDLFFSETIFTKMLRLRNPLLSKNIRTYFWKIYLEKHSHWSTSRTLLWFKSVYFSLQTCVSRTPES